MTTATSASTASATVRHPLARPDFRSLVTGATLAALSVGFFEVPVMWWLAQQGGARAVASVALVGALAYLLAAPVGGVLADRLPKVRLARTGYLIDGALTALAGYLLLQGAFPLAAALVLLAATNLVTAAREPALGALLPTLLDPDEIELGNAAMGLAATVAALASFGVAGAATALLGPAGALFLGSALLLAATLALAFVREPAPPRSSASTSESDRAADGEARTSGAGWGVGFRTLRDSPLLASVALTAALINFVLAPAPVLFAPYVVALGGDATGYGALGMAIVAGQLLGSLLRSARSWGRPLAALVGGTVTLGAGLALLAVAPGLVPALACAAIVGLAASVLNVELQTLIQTRVDPERLGRSLGVFTALSRAAQPAGFALAGAVAGAMGPRDIFLVMGIVTAAMALLWLRPSVATRLARS